MPSFDLLRATVVGAFLLVTPMLPLAATTDALPDGGTASLRAELKALHSSDAPNPLPRIAAAVRQARQLPLAPKERSSLLLHAGSLAGKLGTPGLRVAFDALDEARSLAETVGDERPIAEAYDGLSDLYEKQQRNDEALQLAETGVLHAQRINGHDLLMRLEWRLGRLFEAQGRNDLALAALQRAVRHIEAIRADIPVRYQDGRSSFRETLEPIYLALADLLLRQSRVGTGDARPALLRQARNTVELIKQTELEDYFRDRCTVDSAPPAVAAGPSASTAIYYPIVLPDRLELLVESDHGFEQRTVNVTAAQLHKTIADFIAALRSAGPYRADAERLYGWLIAPIDDLLKQRHVDTLVAVPDGALRLVPLAALHDGSHFLAERLTITTVPGLSLSTGNRPSTTAPRILLAGLSEPGPVVAKLPESVVNQMPETAAGPLARFAPPPGLRSLTEAAQSVATPFPEPAGEHEQKLRTALALPGVKKEIHQLEGLVPGNVLLDQSFTLGAFKQQLADHDFSIVHIASHGLFGASMDDTFIMTYDELLTLNGLQALMTQRRKPVDLITLSACQTAEGDDRAPLGFAGVAIKAHAKSALGTLWPVSDEVTQTMMASFYGNLAHGDESKAGALRAAQRTLIAGGEFDHPFYWAPFILVGDWQ
jgi:CHAT domain-containing protein